MNPYSGTSSLAQARHLLMSRNTRITTTAASLRYRCVLQVLRISAASFGLVYGSVKLGYLKASPTHSQGLLHHPEILPCTMLQNAV